MSRTLADARDLLIEAYADDPRLTAVGIGRQRLVVYLTDPEPGEGIMLTRHLSVPVYVKRSNPAQILGMKLPVNVPSNHYVAYEQPHHTRRPYLPGGPLYRTWRHGWRYANRGGFADGFGTNGCGC